MMTEEYSKRFEEVDEDTHRLKVPGGWLVRTRFDSHAGAACHQIFIKDEHHQWEFNKR